MHQNTATACELGNPKESLLGLSDSNSIQEHHLIQDCPHLVLSNPCSEFVSSLSSVLAKLDHSLSGLCPDKIQARESIELKKLKHKYNSFVSRFTKVKQIQNSVYVYSLVLAKKVQKIVSEKFSFGAGEMVLLYAGCLLLSIKMVLDTEKWFVEDFALVSGLDKASISKIELFLMEECLDFYAGISEEEYRKEYLSLYRKTEKRRARKAGSNK